MGQVNKKHFLEYLNVKFNHERTTRYLGFVRVGKYFIEWNCVKGDMELETSVAWARTKLAGRKNPSWIMRRKREWAWQSSLTGGFEVQDEESPFNWMDHKTSHTYSIADLLLGALCTHYLPILSKIPWSRLSDVTYIPLAQINLFSFIHLFIHYLLMWWIFIYAKHVLCYAWR